MTTCSQIDAGTPADRYRDGWQAGHADCHLVDVSNQSLGLAIAIGDRTGEEPSEIFERVG